MFPETVETDSLASTRLCRERVDVFDLYERFVERREGVEAVFEYVPREPYASVTDVRYRLVETETAWEEGAAARYAANTADDALAGCAGLFPERERRTANLGFVLGECTGDCGYAGECATALTELAFDRLDFELAAIVHEDGSERSKRAVEKFAESVGRQYDGVSRNWTPIGDEIADHHRYTGTREQYRRTTSEK